MIWSRDFWFVQNYLDYGSCSHPHTLNISTFSDNKILQNSMATSAPSTTNSLKTVEWMWKANQDPYSDEPDEWIHYSDVENIILEKAYSRNQPRATLDNYYIDLKKNLQVSIHGSYEERPVKRMVREREDKHLREARFIDLPVGSVRSFGGQYGWVSPFVVEVRRQLGLHPEELPSKKPDLVRKLVKKAAHGIVKEGKRIGKRKEAKEMANILLEKKRKSMEEVWRCCAYLYSLESFLYKNLNAAMRLVGSKDDEQVWHDKVRTLGPFCLLLWDDPYNKKVKCDIELYRGANLKPELVERYQQMANKDEYGSFQSFSSCSRNRSKAEEFGNVLFIMKVLFAFTADLSGLSEYAAEEEELVTPGVCFRVEHVEFDRQKNKHLIYIELRQRFKGK